MPGFVEDRRQASKETPGTEHPMPSVADYGLCAPTEAAAIGALADLVGARTAEGLWDLSARALVLDRPVTGSANLRRMAEHLMSVGDLMRVAGRSMKIQVTTHEALSRAAP
jgi:hypothetical protein